MMDLKVDLEWLLEMDRRQGDVPDPAPFRTVRDVAILEERRRQIAADTYEGKLAPPEPPRAVPATGAAEGDEKKEREPVVMGR